MFRKDILESFDVRTIKVEQAGANSYSIRFYGGNAKANSPHLSETFITQTNRANLALPPEWNKAVENRGRDNYFCRRIRL